MISKTKTTIISKQTKYTADLDKLSQKYRMKYEENLQNFRLKAKCDVDIEKLFSTTTRAG